MLEYNEFKQIIENYPVIDEKVYIALSELYDAKTINSLIEKYLCDKTIDENVRFNKMQYYMGNHEIEASAEDYLDDDVIDVDIENYTDDDMKSYLNEIGKYQLLTYEEEVALFYKLEEAKNKAVIVGIKESGYEEIRNKIASHNLRLAFSIAKKYIGRGIEPLDLVQDANEGLIRAVEKYDVTKGYKFSTYATWWIRQSVTRGIADKAKTIRIPVHAVESINKMERVRKELSQKNFGDVSDEELAKALGWDVSTVKNYTMISQTPASLSAPIGDEEDSVLADFIPYEGMEVEDEAMQSMLRQVLIEVLETLTPREQRVLKLRYGIDDNRTRTLEEVGKEFNVTRERIRQIEAKALRKLRHPSRSKKLKDYMKDL